MTRSAIGLRDPGSTMLAPREVGGGQHHADPEPGQDDGYRPDEHDTGHSGLQHNDLPILFPGPAPRNHTAAGRDTTGATAWNPPSDGACGPDPWRGEAWAVHGEGRRSGGELLLSAIDCYAAARRPSVRLLRYRR